MRTIEDHQTAVDLVVTQYIEAASNEIDELKHSTKPENRERARYHKDTIDLCGKFLELFIDRQIELENYLTDHEMPMGNGDPRTPAEKLADHVDKDKPLGGTDLKESIRDATLTLYSMID